MVISKVMHFVVNILLSMVFPRCNTEHCLIKFNINLCWVVFYLFHGVIFDYQGELPINNDNSALICLYLVEYLIYRVTHKGCDFSDELKLLKSSNFIGMLVFIFFTFIKNIGNQNFSQ